MDLWEAIAQLSCMQTLYHLRHECVWILVSERRLEVPKDECESKLESFCKTKDIPGRLDSPQTCDYVFIDEHSGHDQEARLSWDQGITRVLLRRQEGKKRR